MQRSWKNCGMETEMNDSLKKNKYNIQDIIKILPHRYPFVLIDRINEVKPGEYVNAIKNAAGGEEAYSNMVNWASDNLDPNSSKAFDEVINSGSIDAIKLAVSGLKAEYEKSVGYEGKMVTGKAPVNTKDVYRSQAELVRAMSDPRYDNDPAYRQDVMQKLEQSDNLQF